MAYAGALPAVGYRAGYRQRHVALDVAQKGPLPETGRGLCADPQRAGRARTYMLRSKTDGNLWGRGIMSELTGFWADLRERLTSDPEFARQYLLEWVKVSTVDRIVNELDAKRDELGLSKADLARAVRRDPAAIRRLLSEATGNPTLETVSGVAAAVGMKLELVPMSEEERQALSDPLRELVDC